MTVSQGKIMPTEYHPEQIEREVQQRWENEKCFEVNEASDRPKYYCLSMLPYPSGRLHMGHVRNYAIGDAIARYQRHRGKNVLQPIGWDAFGLPAENAAIERGLAPSKWTYENIDAMRAQLKQLGFGYDWSRELTTCKPEYYRWEQWLFIQLYKKGLAYKKNAVVNWDPVDKTVLANEQVVDGRGWRSGALIERREISQWFIKITDYAEELLNDLDTLKGWPEQVLTMQRNWIGRSEGAQIDFMVNGDQKLTVFTTRADTLFGVTYLAIAPDHPLSKATAKHNPTLAQFIERCQHQKTAEAEVATQIKEGVDTGLTAKHPLTGESLPIWAANFVLMEYGTGAVMAVPAHDQRDFEFAQQYHLPKKPVIHHPDHDYTKSACNDYGVLIDSGEFNGQTSEQALKTILEKLITLHLGKKQIQYRLRDWGISRQRYWGAPIPMIHCKECGIAPVPESQLPVVLPENITPTGDGSPLAQSKSFYETTCPSCGKAAHRETDTFDTFMESSWYYARYTCPNYSEGMLDQRANYWVPIDQYIGGVEHAVMHLLYARFIHKVMRDEGLVKSNEPFTNLLTQGMVLKDGSKMSKSKGNTVDPADLIKQYGADTIRLFILFASPPTQSLEWSDAGVEGMFRFLRRLWRLVQTHQQHFEPIKQRDPLTPAQQATRRLTHGTLQKVTHDISERLTFNTAIAANMELLNHLSQLAMNDATDHQIMRESLEIMIIMLSPITPHMTQALWEALGHKTLLVDAPWPTVDMTALEQNEVTLIVQINGKKRGEITVDIHADTATIESIALNDPHIQKYLGEQPPKKVIVVPKRLVNIVV